jgi:hypothetical protein
LLYDSEWNLPFVRVVGPPRGRAAARAHRGGGEAVRVRLALLDEVVVFGVDRRRVRVVVIVWVDHALLLKIPFAFFFFFVESNVPTETSSTHTH